MISGLKILTNVQIARDQNREEYPIDEISRSQPWPLWITAVEGVQEEAASPPGNQNMFKGCFRL